MGWHLKRVTQFRHCRPGLHQLREMCPFRIAKPLIPSSYSAVSSCLDDMEKAFCSCCACSVCSGSIVEIGGGEKAGSNGSSVCMNEERS